MANNDSPRWIRTSSGYAGRNGYIKRYGKINIAFPYESLLQPSNFELVSDAKNWLDAGKFEQVEPETHCEFGEVSGPEVTD